MICFVVPSYKPNENLLIILKELITKTDNLIFVIDDGSPDKKIFENDIFLNENIILIKHCINLGKGAALKTAFNYILSQYDDISGCVTLDADGQHSTIDAINISHSFQKDIESFILGVRDFSFENKKIPIKSRFGNILTRLIWYIVTRKKISDTQTGLRGLSVSLMKECLFISANRYDFEIEQLLKVHKMKISITEIPIKTIYIDDNKGSHFNPFFDSLKIYFVISRFLLSSLLTYIVDNISFVLLISFFSVSSGFSFIFSRFFAGIVNYYLNKNIVFKSDSNSKISLFYYFLLITINSIIGYFVIDYIEIFTSNVFLAKISLDILLLTFNFLIQKEWIFNKKETKDE